MHWYVWLALLIAIILQVTDAWTTWRILDYGGSEVGFAALLVRWGWPRWAWVGFFKGIFAALAWVAWHTAGEAGLLAWLAATGAFAAYAVWHNLGQVRMHQGVLR